MGGRAVPEVSDSHTADPRLCESHSGFKISQKYNSRLKVPRLPGCLQALGSFFSYMSVLRKAASALWKAYPSHNAPFIFPPPPPSLSPLPLGGYLHQVGTAKGNQASV